MKKTKRIPSTKYYDGRKKEWKVFSPEPDNPTPDNVNKWIDAWEKTEGYPEQETALEKLFRELCKDNTSLSDVLIKVCSLNDFYSTNIYKSIDVAKCIIDLKIDEKLCDNNLHPEIVDDLDKKVKEKTGRSVYSFATKYCSHHQPKLYPIYDSYVEMLLKYYRNTARVIVSKPVKVS